MSAGPDELHLREFQGVTELISDPLQAFFEEVQAMAEVSKGGFTCQKEASIVPVFMKGSTGTIHSCKQCSTMAEEASPTSGITDKYHVVGTRNNPVFCSADMTLLQYCSSLWPVHLRKHKENLETAQSKVPKIITQLATPRIRDLGLFSLGQRRQEGTEEHFSNTFLSHALPHRLFYGHWGWS